MKIQYVFKHNIDKDIQREAFTLDDIEKGVSLDYIHGMKQDGYTLINRLFVEYVN